jgi:hypothetical protein
MEIDQTETSRKRLRDDEEEEEEFKELAKRAKVEMEAEPEYTPDQRLQDIIKETIIGDLLNFNADIFGGAVAFLGIKDIAKLNRLDRLHRFKARQAAAYTDTTTADMAWILNEMGPIENPGRYKNISTFYNVDFESATGFKKAETNELKLYVKRIWYMRVYTEKKKFVPGFDFDPFLVDSMVNLERVWIKSLHYYKFDDVEKRKYPVVIPERVWWLYIEAKPGNRDPFHNPDDFFSNIKTHVKYLRLYTDYPEVDPVSLLSGKSALKVLHLVDVESTEGTIINGSDTENKIKNPLSMLIVDNAHRACYPDLKVDTVVVKTMATFIHEFLSGIRYQGMSTLYLGDVDGINFKNLLNIHTLLPEELTFPVLTHLIIKRWNTTAFGGVEEDEDENPFPDITNELLMEWLDQLTMQIDRFNHFPRLQLLELQLPIEHQVTGLPIEHKFGENNSRTIIIYDEDTKPANIFDIEKEAQKAVSKEDDAKEEEQQQKPRWPKSVGARGRYDRNPDDEEVVDYSDDDEKEEEEEESSLARSHLEREEQRIHRYDRNPDAEDVFDSDDDDDEKESVPVTRLERGDRNRYNVDSDEEVVDEEFGSDDEVEVETTELPTGDEEDMLDISRQVDRSDDDAIAKGPAVVPITDQNKSTVVMTYRPHFPALHYGLFWCDDYDKKTDDRYEVYRDCEFAHDVYKSDSFYYIVRKGQRIKLIDVDTERNTMTLFVAENRIYKLRMAFTLYDSKKITRRNHDHHQPTERKPMSHGVVGDIEVLDLGKKHKFTKIAPTGPKHHHEEDEDEEEERRKWKKAKEYGYVEVCDVKFPSVLVPTGDYSFDPERVKEYLNQIPEPRRSAVEVVLRNTHYIDFVQFITWFKVALDDFKFNFPDKEDRKWLAFVIKLQSSGLWMTLLAMCIDPSLKESCSGLCESKERQNRFEDKPRLNSTGANTFVVFDDCAYTGLQIKESIRWIPTLISEDRPYVDIYIVTAVISLDAIVNILETLVNGYLINYMGLAQMWLLGPASEYIKRHVAMVFEKEPALNMKKRATLFEDIVPDIISKYYPTYVKYYEGGELYKKVKVSFHYGHITDVLRNEIDRKPYINPFQYNQHEHDMNMMETVKKIFGNKHAIYFQHKVPDNLSSYPHLYHGTDDAFWDEFPIMRDCINMNTIDSCPRPPYKKILLLSEFQSWFKKSYLR